MTQNKILKAVIVHNILWATYKAEIFTELNKIATNSTLDISFIQIAETERSRIGLAKVQYESHKYPYRLLHCGSYEEINSLVLARELYYLVKQSDATTVVLPGYSRIEHWAMLIAGLIGSKRIGVFCDSTISDRPQKWYKVTLKKIFFSRCDGVFAYGVRSSEYLLFLGVPRERIFFPCQSAASPKSPMTREEVINSRLFFANKKDYKNIFLYVGRLSCEKGLDVLLEAFKKYIINDPECLLRLVGTGPEATKLKKQSESLGLSARIKFIGALDSSQLAHEYISATALILPSISEPWGLVVNEALYYGCPVVVSSICGCVPELVNVETGFVAEVKSVESLCEGMKEIVKVSRNNTTPGSCRDAVDRFTPTNSARNILNGLFELSTHINGGFDL